MTIIAYGDRMDAVEQLKDLPAVEFVRYPDFEEGKDFAYQMTLDWVTPTIPRKQLVFVDPPKDLKPKALKPRRDRHVLFTDGKLPAAWKTWGAQEGVELRECGFDEGKVIAFLVAGNAEAGIPRFTREAAEIFASQHPGGLATLHWPIEALKAAGAKEPIRREAVLALWPFDRKAGGKVYTVALGDLIKSLGRKEAISLANQVPEKESFGALKGLEVACKSNQNRVKLIQFLLDGIDKKRWNPKAALVIFTLTCLQEAAWQSKSKAHPSPSPLQMIPFRLLNIGSSRIT